DEVSPATPHTPAEQGLEGPADGDGTPATVDRIGERETDDHVDRPGVHTPVKVGLRQSLLRELVAVAFDSRPRVGEVAERLTHAVEHQADAHSSGEEEREPG